MMFRVSLSGLAFTALAACNSGGSGATSVGGYTPLDANVEAVSTLGGAALKISPTRSLAQLDASSGRLNHDTGAIELDDGTYVLRDPDGASGGKVLTDSTSLLIKASDEDFSKAYSYVQPYTQSYIAGTVPYVVVGLYGVVTQPQDMPLRGTARYVGEADASYSDNGTAYDLDGGRSVIEADFGSGSVDVALNRFTVTERDTGARGSIGFDAIEIDGMRITGNQFKNGRLRTKLGGRTVQVLGTVRQAEALGRFFGPVTSGSPAEVGGVAFLRGDDGSITAVFVAD